MPADISIVAANPEDIVGDTLFGARDQSTLLKVVGTDGAGGEIELDASRISWTIDDPASLDLIPLGTACIATGLRDWFDTIPEGGDASAGTEPAMTLTVEYRGLRKELPASIVIDAEGTWTISVSSGSLSGNEPELVLVQVGRTLIYEELGFTAEITGRHISLTGFGFAFEGDFTERNAIQGTYADLSGGSGEWSGTKN